MNDPWDVKCVRLGHQYQSCMKLNGVPLLPPVLSRECRKEMEYYRLLAKEVENRISALQSFIVDHRNDSGDEPINASQLPESGKLKAIENEQQSAPTSPVKENVPNPNQIPSKSLDSKLLIDVNVKLKTSYRSPTLNELPERDFVQANEIHQEEIITDIESNRNHLIHQLINLDVFKKTNFLVRDLSPTFSAKSFTGSLNDLHGEIAKEARTPPLTRQRSYTLLNPSPQLLAHLEIQSLNTGVDVQAISMSEPTPTLSPNGKKRKSWDLESAKVKWSSMAQELKENIGNKPRNQPPTNVSSKPITRKPQNLNTSLQEKSRKTPVFNISGRTPKSEPLQKLQNTTPKAVAKKPASHVQGTLNSASYVIDKEDKSNKENTVAIISKSEDPGVKVRELYEKLQKQHMMQMENLLEKQKKEQKLLQQVFEEQNNLLLKQLKMVCPKATIPVKEAWGEQNDDVEGHPVSLSQLLHSTPANSIPNSPLSKTLTDTKSCLNKCDNVLKQSRDITNSIKKGIPATGARNANGIKNHMVTNNMHSKQVHDSPVVRRNRSPAMRNNTSRKLNYDTSASTDYEPMLSDRTNDTMADLNVTFPSDNEEIVTTHDTLRRNSQANSPDLENHNLQRKRELSPRSRCANSAIRNYEEAIQNMTIVRQPQPKSKIYSTEQREAATKIVACAKGYLVRRLMRTERVQATVQTIKDALLCALQLHQGREGIRGADVDLHRRLIQQITAACYNLHDTFIGSSTKARCDLIAADRSRKQAHISRSPSSARHSLGDDE